MSKGRNLLRQWIVNHTEEEQHKEIDEMVFLSYPYEKYGEYTFAFYLDGNKKGINYEICNLSKRFTDGLYVGYEETLPFVEYLGERMVLALNYFTGKSNEEIKKLLEENQNE
jgi:hypothetical protein